MIANSIQPTGRPAFDCRGSAVITFDRSSRAITIKYDHTLLHKTVAELSELYPTPERQLGPGAQKLQQQKTPKKPASERKEKRPASEKKTRDPNAPKKRRKKNNGEAQDTFAPEGPMIPPDYPTRPQENASSRPEQNPSQQGGAVQQSDGAHTQVSNPYPSGLVNEPETSGQSAVHNTPAPPLLPFNVSADEASRRVTIARKLLSEAGVDPESLSVEQMNIFANQSPELQKDSIAMLARYGAERLQIIHPNKDKAAADSSRASTSHTGSSSPSPTPAADATTTTKELSLQTASDADTGRTGTSGKSGAKNDDSTKGTRATSKRGLGKSRLACNECKSHRVKVR